MCKHALHNRIHGMYHMHWRWLYTTRDIHAASLKLTQAIVITHIQHKQLHSCARQVSVDRPLTRALHSCMQVPGTEIQDPTNNGAKCDFCSWQTLTATDPGFHRIELPNAVTGSNLFKYAEPSHGIVLFKHHQPLVFSQEALSDMLDAAWLWFQASHKLNPTAVEPFFLWNCLPRAGASQYHGHAQVCNHNCLRATCCFSTVAIEQ